MRQPASTDTKLFPQAFAVCIAMFIIGSGSLGAQSPSQPRISSHSVPILTVDGLRFRDLNRNGKLDPFEDWRLTPEQRAEDLLSRLSLDEKAGLMMHGTAPAKSSPIGSGTAYDLDAARDLIRTKNVNTLITRLSASPTDFATQDNHLQELAEETRFAIPLTLSTDPRNVFTATLGASNNAGSFSQWPGPLGFAAAGDSGMTRQFADAARAEYLAVGIDEALSPQADLATEPRWPRIDGTFGEDAQLAKRMVEAYVAGFQDGETGLHPGSVLCVVKHWVGYGAAKDGWDSHNAYGKNAVFPGNNFAYHQVPFEGAFAAHVAAVMPTYSILNGVTVNGNKVEPVGAGFSKVLLTQLLRGQYGFQGVVLSDWLITSDCNGECAAGAAPGASPTIVPGHHGMSWGVEALSLPERYAKAVNAGVDQFGGVSDSDVLVGLVKDGKLSETRLNESDRRILVQKFAQGLFEAPFVDAPKAGQVLGNSQTAAASLAAQRRSMVLLENKHNILPLSGAGRKVYLYGIDPKVAMAHGLIPVASPEEADVALFKMHAPFQNLHPQFFFGSRQHEGDLDFKADDPQFREFERVSAKVPTVVFVYLDRPAVLTPLHEQASAVLADFGASDQAMLDVATGKAAPGGKLPFELPSSMSAVLVQKSDVPHDSARPLYPIFYGLSYEPNAKQ